MILDAMADALGGRAALASISTETVTATGWRRHPGWGKNPAEPELVAEFSYTMTADVVRPLYRLEMTAETRLVPTALRYLEVGNGSAGYVDGIDFMFDPRPVSMPIPSWRVAARLRHLDLTSVPRLAAKLLAPAADLVIDGRIVHDETRTSIELDRAADFRLADDTVTDAGAEQAAYAQHSTEWIMNYVFAGVRFYFDLQIAPAEPEPVEIAAGVKIVLGPSHNVLVVEMADHVVAVDAPLYDEYARSALAQVKRAFPGKPLRAVVGTHFHYDHIGGIREFVADGGVRVIVGEPSVPFFKELVRSPHTVDPDRLAANPVPVDVIGVTDVLELPTADGGVMRIRRITTDHSDDGLVVHLSKPGILYQSDLWNPTPAMPAPNSGRGRLATQLYDAIVQFDLDVKTVVGGHRGTDGHTLAHAAPLAYLRTAAGR